jgi:TolB-like protein/class 3 adenylate cyclase
MATGEEKTNLRLEIAHVLFMDIVGYSKLLIDEQRESLHELNNLVRNAEAVQQAEATNSLIRLPTGDGMALVFTSSMEAPVECALQISQALRAQPSLPLRMGIHSGSVQHVTDVNGRENIAGNGINIAQRVMDCGDAGHILVSKRVADDLAGSRRWAPYLHELGDCEVKHGVVVSMVNLYADVVGNPVPPAKFGGAKTGGKTSALVTAPTRVLRWLPWSLAALMIVAFTLWRGAADTHKNAPIAVAGPSFPVATIAPSPSIAPAPAALPAIPEKSVAVLPFESLSSDKENSYFTDGVQDEILTDLAKVADLKVISRTSVMKYKETGNRDLREIGQQLGVSHLLEGSVQRAGNKVRVNAQLIDARTDAHLWAEDYDRPLDDVFAIQSEIAEAIVRQLQAAISPAEHAAMSEQPTANVGAFEQYARGKDIFERCLDLDDERTGLLRAIDRLEDATRRDPGFVEAYCYAAQAHDFLYYSGLDATPDRRALAETALNNALRLRPDAGEVHLARARHYFHCYHDYARAVVELALARRSLPNSAQLYMLSGGLNRGLGHWEDSIREFQKACELDPRNANALDLLADTYELTHRFADAARIIQQSVRDGIDPRLAAVEVARSGFAATGSTKEWSVALGELPGYIDPSGGVTPERIIVALAEGDYRAADAALAASALPAFQDVDFSFYYPRAWYEANIARAAGDPARMRTAFAACRKVLEERPETQSEDPRTLAVLAQVDAALGDKERALREGLRAVELMPISRDAYDGPLVLQGLAQVYVWNGDKKRAIDVVETLIGVPGYLTYGYLLKDPSWSPLRGDPRFDALVASLAPKP